MRIRAITVEADYCFGPEPLKLDELEKVNFLFAPNGTGKTTISAALARQPEAEDERRYWPTAPTQLRIRVFNEDYRAKVLTEHVAGIFTLGKESKAINEKIALLENGISERAAKSARIQAEIGSAAGEEPTGLKGELAQARREAEEAVWEDQKAVPKDIRETVFSGFRGAKADFFREALKRWPGSEPADPGVTWEQVAVSVASLSGSMEEAALLPTVPRHELLQGSDMDLLAEPILPKGDGPLAELISELRNSEWVGKGRDYYPNRENKCPFCQQAGPPDLERQLEEYFSSTYLGSQRSLKQLLAEVESRSAALSSYLDLLEQSLEAQSVVDATQLADLVEGIKKDSALLLAEVEKKVAHPAEVVRPQSVGAKLRQLDARITAGNKQIEEHNLVVSNTKKARAKIKEQGWVLFLRNSQVQAEIRGYLGKEKSKQKKLDERKQALQAIEKSNREDRTEIARLRESISNTQSVAERINDLLLEMGFRRFKLQIEDTVAGGYRIVRNDGSLAFETLSEGEKTFLTFTYFWESLKGTLGPDETADHLAVIVDDPISSLDSDSLFIVADTIRRGAQEILEGSSNIRQLLVLTHNTQFHQEASYAGKWTKKTERRFYRLQRGPNGDSIVKNDDHTSRIRNNYALLWDYVVAVAKSDEDTSVLQAGLYNIVRRIIETYFRWLGNVERKQWPQQLPAASRRTLSVLDAWANAGSHKLADDIDRYTDLGQVRRFLTLFQDFFYYQDQQGHFNMMVSASGVEELLKKGGVFYRPVAPPRIGSGVGETGS